MSHFRQIRADPADPSRSAAAFRQAPFLLLYTAFCHFLLGKGSPESKESSELPLGDPKAPLNRISLLESKISLLENMISLLESRIFLLDNSICLLESRIPLLENRIYLLESRMFLLDNRISSFEDRICHLRYTKISTHAL